MTDDDQAALNQDLAELRRSLASEAPSPELGTTLGRYARAHPRRRATARHASRWPWAAAIAALVVGSGVVWQARQDDIDAVTSPEPAWQDPMSAASGDFIPLSYGAIADEGDAFTIVRVKLDRMALVHAGLALPLPVEDEFIDADLLIGIDGSVFGIRFVEHGSPGGAMWHGEPALEESI